MRNNQKHNLSYLKDTRKVLRHNSTSAEATLWNILKNSQLDGSKFQRQHSIENFIVDFYCPIVDFYCPAEKLIVELDGQGYFTLEGKFIDSNRDEQLTGLGYKIIRIENKEVFNNPETVINYIKGNFEFKI